MALIPAAGTGSRTGATIPKQYLAVADRTMIVRTIEAFAAVARIDRIVVVIAPDDDHFETLDFEPAIALRLRVVRGGGATRHASVENGLADLDGLDADDWVLVHDAARCGVTAELIDSMLDRLQDDAVGGLLALPMDDTVKREAEPDGRGRGPVVDATIDRTRLWRAQTPQMFRYGLLRAALAAAGTAELAVTDEASAMEAAGHRVALVPGSPRNFKVTSADDLRMMEALLQAVPSPTRDAEARTASHPESRTAR